MATQWGTVHGMPPWGMPTKKKKAEWEKYIGTMPSITGEQAAVSTPMSEYLAEAIKGFGAAPSFEDWAKTNMPDMFGGTLGSQVQNYYAEALKGITPDMFGGALGSQAQAAYAEALSGVAPDVFGGPLGAQAQAAYMGAMTGLTPQMFGGELGAEAKGAYAEALSGEFPEEYYQKSIYDPAMEEFMQDIMPALKESYVGTGAITGTEVGERIGREAGRLQTSLTGIRAQLGQQAKQRSYEAAGNYMQAFQMAEGANRNRALSAAGMYQTAYQSGEEQAKQRQLMAAGNYQQAYQSAVEQAKARQLSGATSLAQYNLEYTKIAYDNYVRQNPAASEILQAALSYLNIPIMGVYQKPEPSKPARETSSRG